MANDFALQLTRAARNINEHTETVVRGTISGINRKIIMRTPVGDPDLWVTKNADGVYVDYVAYRGYPSGYVGGSLRGGWQASIGSPSTVVTGVPDPTGASTIQEANAVVMTLQIGQKYYLSNPFPHAIPVEYGWSTQMPNGMLRRSVAEANQVLAGAAP